MEDPFFSTVSKVDRFGCLRKYRQDRPANDANYKRRIRLGSQTRYEAREVMEEKGRWKEKCKNVEVGEDTQLKKPRLSTPTSTSTSSTSVYAAFTELWEKTMKQYEDHITQLQEQLWEQQEKSESLARAYNEETRAARLRIAELETENTALKEKVGLTRKAMESLKNLMEL